MLAAVISLASHFFLSPWWECERVRSSVIMYEIQYCPLLEEEVSLHYNTQRGRLFSCKVEVAVWKGMAGKLRPLVTHSAHCIGPQGDASFQSVSTNKFSKISVG